MPASSRPEGALPVTGFDLALIALSARALARSARRGGLRALTIDLFADADTKEHAALAVKARPSARGPGFDRRSLVETLAAHAPEGLPVVLGAGFEHAPALMREIGRRNPILGASPETVARLKDPRTFAGLLAELGVPHPEIAGDGGAPLHLSPVGREPAPDSIRGRRAAPGEGEQPSPDNARAPHPLGFADRSLPAGERWAESAAPRNWLSKRVGASGGAHIRLGDAPGPSRYVQERVEGRSLSALFLADGARAQVLGFSEQWTDPAPRAPYRYGGAVGPVPAPPAFAESLRAALDGIVAATGLTGLASADMIVPTEGPAFWLIEINPRPGATLDVFDRSPWPSLLALHLDACAGRLPGPLPALSGAAAAAVVHAPARVAAKAVERPHWTADWPSCDETIPLAAPFCTAFAAGRDPSAARRLLDDRRTALLTTLKSARVPAPTNPSW